MSFLIRAANLFSPVGVMWHAIAVSSAYAYVAVHAAYETLFWTLTSATLYICVESNIFARFMLLYYIKCCENT